MKNSPNKIIVFDTTLRDGEQAPRSSIRPKDKVDIAHMLDAIGVDVIEAGYPISSEGNFQSVRDIAATVRRPVIAALSLCRQDSIEAAARALEGAERPRIHVYLGSSDIHRGTHAKPLGRQEYLDMTTSSVERARRHVNDVEFSPEDATRTDPDFLVQIGNAVYQAGATTFNVPDTVGTAHPWDTEGWDPSSDDRQPGMRQLFRYLADAIPAVRCGDMVLSTHNHDDLGLATANTIAALQGGARQAEMTINGVGERAGNAALEEVVMAVRKLDRHLRVDHIRMESFMQLSRTVSGATTIFVPPNKAIGGSNAFKAQAGTHIAKMLRDPRAYGTIQPEEVGADPTDIIDIGPQSGSRGLMHVMDTLGYSIPADKQQAFYNFCMHAADEKRGQGSSFTADELHVLAYQFFAFAIPIAEHDEEVSMIRFLTSWPDNGHRFVEIFVKIWAGYESGKRVPARWSGVSQENQGAFQAVAALLRAKTRNEFSVIGESQEAIGTGEEALSRATVTIECGDRQFTGTGMHTDLEESTIRALLDAVNRTYLPVKQS